jgi:methyltransferase
MSTNPVAQQMDRMVGAYFDACSREDPCAIAACFAPDAVHYLPHLPPFLSGGAIGAAIVADLRNRGGQYFIDRVFCDVEQRVASVEWTRSFQQPDRVLRGFEICEFDPATMLIREIRGYYAAAPSPDKARHEIVGFDYQGRGYRTSL